ncbi:cation:proton antiporter [Plantactinospora siamensis]|uniref:Cation:proton antiporter n=1 Tax=Plantactinospora siamensis TaxID=555372 RepID=A0ABV6P2L4_9ACTN
MPVGLLAAGEPTGELTTFGVVLGAVALAAMAAVLSNRLSDLIRVPAPALFLFAAAAASDLFPRLGTLAIGTVREIVTVALILVLFSGGMEIGWRRLRPALVPVLSIGVLGTVFTAVALAAAAHLLFDFAWLPALLLGTALAPTDPAAVFSVLGRREVVGRAGTILEGESGANDPVGIALMLSLLAAGTASGWSAVGTGLREFVLQLGIGGVVGLLGGRVLLLLMRRVSLPSEGLYPLQVLFGGAAVYGLATLAHGSGFLAVFLAGILIGDARAPFKLEIERFHGALASLGEIVAFTVLGLGVSLRGLHEQRALLVGLVLAVLLALLIRPLLVGGLLTVVRLRWGERIFIAWSGLKGAVPILLATFILTADVPEQVRLFDVVFVVVAFSVVVQGGLVPTVARLCGVRMRSHPLQPFAVGLRVSDEPRAVRRLRVADGSAVVGRTVRELSRDEGIWVNLVSRGGQQLGVQADTTLAAGDEVLVTTHNAEDHDRTTALFDAPPD